MEPTPLNMIQLATAVTNGETIEKSTYQALAGVKISDIFSMMAGADIIRNAFFKNQVHLCTICNGKSGRCSENCSFCSQSRHVKTDIDIYPLLSKEKLQEGAISASRTPVNRYSVVTSGRRLPRGEVTDVAQAFSELEYKSLSFCASLGILGKDDFQTLKQAGVSRYHHNLETAGSHFENICTTHTFQERVNTIKAAKSAGLSICSGGIFGIGETFDQVLELALELKALDVDAVPVNFLSPIKGTPLEFKNDLTPLKCLKIISLLRYVLPDKDILVCGGRLQNLGMLHPMIFFAGASGLMTGRYLTTEGNQLDNDIKMIQQLGFIPRPSAQ